MIKNEPLDADEEAQKLINDLEKGPNETNEENQQE